MKNVSKKLNWILTLCGAIAVGIILCIIVELIPKSFSTADLTTEKLYTISDSTKKVLKELSQKVTIYALFDKVEGEEDTGTQGKAEIVKLLDLYDGYDKVNVEYIDLEKNPKFLQNTVGKDLATEYSEGDYIVKSGDRTIKVTDDDLYEVYEMTTEEMYQYYLSYGEIPTVTKYTTGLAAEKAFTGSILRAISEAPVIYYDTGFGENDISNYSTITDYLYNCGFDLKAIDLSSTETIPDDAKCLLFFGPDKDLTDKARELVFRWLRDGRSAFFFMDIKKLSDTTKVIYDEFKCFNEIFSYYGMALENTIVSDTEENTVTYAGANVIRVTPERSGSLESIAKGLTINVTNTRSIDVSQETSTGTATAILKTSSGGTREYISGEGSAKASTVTIGASGTYNYLAKTSKICVFGSSATFADTSLKDFGQETAKAILYSSLTWMELESKSNVESLIPTREYTYTTLQTTETQEKVIALVTMIILPAIILLIGVVVFIRRRHL